MRAFFKEDTKIIIRDADKNEVLLIAKLLSDAALENKTVVLRAVEDVAGEVTGFSISVEDVTPEA